MLDKKEQKLLDEVETQQDLERIRENTRRIKATKLPTKWLSLMWLGVIFGVAFAIIGVALILGGLSSGYRWNILDEEGRVGFPVYFVPSFLLIALGVLIIVYCLIGIFKKKRKFGESIMLSPDGEVPEYPEETIAKKAVEPLKRDIDRPMAVRKVYADDPEKRVIKMDKKKVERVLDHNITFPKLRDALIQNLAIEGYHIDELTAAELVAALALTRNFFITGLDQEGGAALVRSLGVAMKAREAFALEGTRFLDDLSSRSPALEPNQSFIFGIGDVDGSNASTYLGTAVEPLSDYSADHNLGPDGSIRMNDLFFFFLKEKEFSGIPADLLEESIVLPIALDKLAVNSTEDPLVVRSSGDEIRYMSLREKSAHFINDELTASFDQLYAFAASKEHPISNDCENAFERFEAALLLLGLSDEKAAGLVVAHAYLPYLLSVLDKADVQGDGGLREVLERGFSNEESSSFIRAAMRGQSVKGGAA